MGSVTTQTKVWILWEGVQIGEVDNINFEAGTNIALNITKAGDNQININISSSGGGSSVPHVTKVLQGDGAGGYGTGYDVGISANDLIQLDSNAKIPAIDGSQLTNTPIPSGVLKLDQTSPQSIINGTPTFPDLKLADMVIGTPTYTSIKDWFGTLVSAGKVSGFTVTEHSPANGTVDVSSGTGILKESNSVGADTRFFNFAGQSGITLTDNTSNFLYLDYNGGSPLVQSTTDRTTIHLYDQFNLGRVFRNGNSVVDIYPSGMWIDNFCRRINDWKTYKWGLDHISGSVVSEQGTRGIAVTAGEFYVGVTQIISPAFATPGDSFLLYHRSSTPGQWTLQTGQTQLGNSQYDNGSGTLADLSGGNHYGIYWVYVCALGHVYILYGQGDYTLSNAHSAQPPTSVPTVISSHGALAAKIIFLNGATNFLEVDSAWVVSFIPGMPADHNELSGLQGGTSGQYYHLTSAQVTIATQTATGSVSGYLASGDWTTFNGKITGSGCAKLTVASSAPGSPSAGDLWINTT